LFGGKSWALSLAAAPPFARIPHNVSVVNMATEQGRRLLQAARSQLLPFLVILRYDPARRSVEEVAPDDPSLG
jgi:hypothetical protein